MNDDREVLGGASDSRPNGSTELPDCAQTRDLIPLRYTDSDADGFASQVEAHIAECPECAQEDELIRSLRLARAEPPAGLSRRVMRQLADEAPDAVAPMRVPAPRRIPSWGFAAAAAVVLALGVGTFWSDGATPNREALVATLVEGLDGPGPDSWMVAGAPVWDALPDEVLQGLIQEEGS